MKINILKNRNSKRISSFMLALFMVLMIVSPVFAREYYNYESRYTITMSDESYSKMSKVNDNLMSIILGDGVSVTFSATNYYGHLSDEDKAEGLTEEDYSVGAEVFSATYNDATYMKDEFFSKKLSNVNGVTEMAGVTLVNINGFDFWEMSYNYFGEPAESEEGEDSEETKDEETKDEEKKEDTGNKTDENDSSDTQDGENTDAGNQEETKQREDGLVVVGEGKMYFTVYKGYSYNVHMMCREGKISDYPEMQEMFGSIRLGLRQSGVMKLMWIVIGVLCAILFVLIILTLRLKSPKKLARLRAEAGLDENGKFIAPTLSIEGDVGFNEEEQLKNNEMVNAKLEQIAKDAKGTENNVDEAVTAELADAEDIDLSLDIDEE